MYVVSYLENRIVLLTQLCRTLPSEGESIKIKGKKGKITTVSPLDEKHVHIHVTLETVNKNKLAAVDNSKKKKR